MLVFDRVAGGVFIMSVGTHAHAARGGPASVAPGRIGRARLFSVLGWAAGGTVASATLALLYALLADMRLGQMGARGALHYVLIELAVFAGVATLVSRMTPSARLGAHVLLWGTALIHMVLINAFASALTAGDAELGTAFGGFVASAVCAAGVVMVLVGCVATAIGLEGRRSTPLRWGAVLALVGLPTALVAPSVWWMGVLAACLLVWTADGMLSGFRRHAGTQGPALAACAVAGVVALVLLGIFIVWRHALRFVVTAVETFAAS